MKLFTPICSGPPASFQGIALIEALVATLIMALGMLALVGLQGNLRRSADLAKQRGEAARLAQSEIESLRAYSILAHPDPDNPSAGTLAYADLSTQTPNTDAGDPSSNTVYTLTRTVTPWEQGQSAQTAVRIRVDWLDRSAKPQFAMLDSIISRADPGLSAALMVAPTSLTIHRPKGREASIPLGAHDLGNGKSVFVPSINHTVAWVFNNLNGVIIGKCAVAMGTLSSGLSAADVATCSDNSFGYLLSGFVRFSLSAPPDSSSPSSNAEAVDVGLVAQAPAHDCYDDSAQVIAQAGKVISYHCIVYPSNSLPRFWSGRLDLSGLPLTTGAANQRKVCRYSADYDRNGILSNAEHPQDYVNVTGALTRQNFLVIPAAENCPAGHGINPAAGWFSNTATVQHQP
jgi:Tfp pilus assembly protein PilV